MTPEIPEKKPADKKSALPGSDGAETSAKGEESDPTKQSEKTPADRVAEIGAGMKGVSQKLLNQIPPDLREKIIEQARTNGPGSAAIAVNAAAMKTRNLKVKFALKGLGKLLQVLDSKVPRK